MNQTLTRELYQKYSKDILLYIYNLCHDWSVAEDILQDTFVKVMLAYPKGHPNICAWLRVVARNEFLNYVNKRENKNVSFEEAKPVCAESQDGLEHVIAVEQNQLLIDAINSLEDRLREVLVLQYYENLPLREIAARMNLSNENVRVLSHRAKKKVKIYMESKR